MTSPLVDMRSRALDMAARGFKVFPCEPNGKMPTSERFYERAANDTSRVHAMWSDPVTGEPEPWNIGVLLGDGCFVLDVDVKNGKRGDASLVSLVDDLGLELNTATVVTPTGGKHLYYAIPPGTFVGNPKNRLGDGIDVKGFHGYVLGPGSTIEGEEYRWEKETPMVSAPEWLVDTIRRAAPRDDKGLLLGDLDRQADIDRAKAYLLKDAPEAVEHANGDDTTFRVICRLLDFGISKDTVLELLLDHWNEEKAHPPWPVEDLVKKIDNAWNYRREPIGNASAALDFDPIPPELVVDRRKAKGVGQADNLAVPTRLFRRKFSEARGRALMAAASPLVKRLLSAGAMSVVYGESNTGKTFVVLDLAFHIATGMPWDGRKVTPGLVVYVAAEAGEDLNPRLEAIARHYSASEEPPLDIVPCPVNLLDENADLKPLIRLIKDASEEYGQPVALVVIDTLARALAGGDENSSVDMGKFVRHIDRIRVETGAHVLVVHHSGKDRAKGARGHSSLRAATDTEIEIADGVIRVTKQRAMQGGQEIGFKLMGVEIGRDEDGDAVTSCVVTLRSDNEFERLELTKAEEQWFEILEAEVIDQATAKGVPVSEFKLDTEFISATIERETNGSIRPTRQNVQKKMTDMTQKGYFRKIKRGQWVMSNDTICYSNDTK